MSFSLAQLLGTPPDESGERFLSLFVPQVFTRQELLLAEGQTERYLSVVEQGMLRTFFRRGDREFTTDFIFPGQFASAYDSFLTRQPSALQVEALSNGRLMRVGYDALQRLYAEDIRSQETGRKAAEHLYIRKALRERSLLADTPEERYRQLLDAQPEYIREIPLKHLASYLGVTPETLSRIRARIS